MKVNDFVNMYSEEFVVTFLSEDQPEKSVLAKISSFLFEPVYEVDNLKFKLVS